MKRNIKLHIFTFSFLFIAIPSTTITCQLQEEQENQSLVEKIQEGVTKIKSHIINNKELYLSAAAIFAGAAYFLHSKCCSSNNHSITAEDTKNPIITENTTSPESLSVEKNVEIPTENTNNPLITKAHPTIESNSHNPSNNTISYYNSYLGEYCPTSISGLKGKENWITKAWEKYTRTW